MQTGPFSFVQACHRNAMCSLPPLHWPIHCLWHIEIGKQNLKTISVRLQERKVKYRSIKHMSNTAHLVKSGHVWIAKIYNNLLNGIDQAKGQTLLYHDYLHKCRNQIMAGSQKVIAETRMPKMTTSCNR